MKTTSYTLLFYLAFASYKVQAAGCYARDYRRENRTDDWTPADAAQVEQSVTQCDLRYGKCLKLFTKVRDRGYTVVCGGEK